MCSPSLPPNSPEVNRGRRNYSTMSFFRNFCAEITIWSSVLATSEFFQFSKIFKNKKKTFDKTNKSCNFKQWKFEQSFGQLSQNKVSIFGLKLSKTATVCIERHANYTPLSRKCAFCLHTSDWTRLFAKHAGRAGAPLKWSMEPINVQKRVFEPTYFRRFNRNSLFWQ